jgi:tRNA 5-methylaminomethyl-2-thiouridine biosynthesis bifunctional protein
LGLDESMALPLGADEAKQVCGISQSGVWLPRGASLNLFNATNQALKNHDLLTSLWNTRVTRLENRNDQWFLFDEKNEVILSADRLVIAAAMESKTLLSSIGIRVPLKPVRGQLSIFSIYLLTPAV